MSDAWFHQPVGDSEPESKTRRSTALCGPAAERSILSRTVLHLPPQTGGQEEFLRTAPVKLRKPRGRYEIVDFSDELARFNGVERFVHHRPTLKGPLGYGFPRD